MLGQDITPAIGSAVAPVTCKLIGASPSGLSNLQG